MSEWIALLKEVARGKHGSNDLPPEEAARVFGALLDGRLPELEAGAFLVAWRMKTESAAEYRGMYQALRERVEPLAYDGAPAVLLPSYNGARRLANLTPLLALALRELGLGVLLHGPRAVSGRVASADILPLLDVPVAVTRAQAQHELRAGGIVFADIAALSPQLDRVMRFRERLGLRNAAHTLVKMTDFLGGAGLPLASMTHPEYIATAREFFRDIDGQALVFRGLEGEPVAHPGRCPDIFRVGRGSDELLVAQGVGVDAAQLDLPAAIDAQCTAQWTREVLAGQRTLPAPLRELLACCLLATRQAETLGAARARVSGRWPG